MTLQSFLGSVPSSTIRLHRSLVKAPARTKHTVMQRECGAQHSVSNLCHNYTGFSLTVFCFQLAFYSPNALLPRLFCFLHNASLSSSMYVSLSHTICLSCGSQLEPTVSLLHPEAIGLNRKENIFTPLMALCGAHCNASRICNTASKLDFFFFPNCSYVIFSGTVQAKVRSVVIFSSESWDFLLTLLQVNKKLIMKCLSAKFLYLTVWFLPLPFPTRCELITIWL